MLEFGNDAMELHDVVAVWAAAKNPPVKDDAEEVDLGLMEGWGATRRKFAMERYVLAFAAIGSPQGADTYSNMVQTTGRESWRVGCASSTEDLTNALMLLVQIVQKSKKPWIASISSMVHSSRLPFLPKSR